MSISPVPGSSGIAPPPPGPVEVRVPATGVEAPNPHGTHAAVAAPAPAGAPASAPPAEAKLREQSAREIESSLQRLHDALYDSPIRLSFRFHEAADRMMVQIIDPQRNEVLKEIPPKELLDLLARIRKAIGILLDEKV